MTISFPINFHDGEPVIDKKLNEYFNSGLANKTKNNVNNVLPQGDKIWEEGISEKVDGTAETFCKYPNDIWNDPNSPY